MAATKKITIKIEGEVGKYNTLPVDYLVNLAKNLQTLIQDIANYDLSSEESIDLSNFKLELSDFRAGSAVPSFVFSVHTQHTLVNVDRQRNEVREKFNSLMSVSDEGNYLVLKNEYPEPLKRNKITHSLYEFVNSIGTAPATILDDNYKPLYKIRQFKKSVHDSIVSPFVKSDFDKKKIPESHTQLARVEIIEGKSRPKVLELFDKKYNHLEFAPDIIVVGNKTYDLRFPLQCTMDTIEGQVQIENKLLGIYAFGSTPDEAEQMFNEEFDYLFSRYNELSDDKLTDDVKVIKSLLNHIVKK